MFPIIKYTFGFFNQGLDSGLGMSLDLGKLDNLPVTVSVLAPVYLLRITTGYKALVPATDSVAPSNLRQASMTVDKVYLKTMSQHATQTEVLEIS